MAVVVVICVAILAVVVARQHSSNSVTSANPSSSASNFTCPDTAFPPDPRVQPDCYFVFMMTNRAGVPASHGVPMSLITDAHQACAAMDQAAAGGGNDPPSLSGVALVRRKHPELSLSDATYFAGIALAAYCPWNARN